MERGRSSATPAFDETALFAHLQPFIVKISFRRHRFVQVTTHLGKIVIGADLFGDLDAEPLLELSCQ